MNTKEKMDFPRMCRELRMSRNWRLKDVAQALNLRSYQNVEYNNHKTIRLDRVIAIARLYQLDPDSTSALTAAWEALPVSEYSERQRTKWKARNATRSKARGYDEMYRALLEVLALLFMAQEGPPGDVGDLCVCEFGGGTANDPTRSCELCNALQQLGLTGWTNHDQVSAHLAALQEKIDAPPAASLPDSGNA